MDVMPGYIGNRSLKDRQAVTIEQRHPLTLNLPLWLYMLKGNTHDKHSV